MIPVVAATLVDWLLLLSPLSGRVAAKFFIAPLHISYMEQPLNLKNVPLSILNVNSEKGVQTPTSQSEMVFPRLQSFNFKVCLKIYGVKR